MGTRRIEFVQISRSERSSVYFPYPSPVKKANGYKKHRYACGVRSSSRSLDTRDCSKRLFHTFHTWTRVRIYNSKSKLQPEELVHRSLGLTIEPNPQCLQLLPMGCLVDPQRKHLVWWRVITWFYFVTVPSRFSHATSSNVYGVPRDEFFVQSGLGAVQKFSRMFDSCCGWFTVFEVYCYVRSQIWTKNSVQWMEIWMAIVGIQNIEYKYFWTKPYSWQLFWKTEIFELFN